ncbi:MAG: ABC transporter substrate-binding protein [Bdellovibrionales bacterium]|nr:ABC transporter substrate-binding protein [Bdellovibrionales bacterium]
MVLRYFYFFLLPLFITVYIYTPLSTAFIFSFFKSEKAKQSKFHKEKQSVIVALGSEPRLLDPRRATDANSMRIVDLLFHSLVRLGPRLDILPSAAQSWNYKDKVYTFIIDNNLKFSNGRKLTKEDLLFSFQEYRSEKSPFSSSFQIIESVNVEETEEQFILTVKLKEESAKFLQSDIPVLKILPKPEVLSAGSKFYKNPIGTGPFKLKHYSSRQIILDANKQNTPAPHIDEVIFKIVRDSFTRFQKMLNKEVDIAQSEMAFDKFNYFLDRKEDFTVFRRPGLTVTYLLINFKDECLKQRNIRQVLALSIDRSKIIQYKLSGFAHEATTILSPNNFFFNRHIKNPAYAPKQAKSLFNQWSRACRQKIFSLKTSNARSAVDHGKVLSMQLKKIGLKVRMESFEWGTFYGDLNAGRFQLALLKWIGVIDPDIYRLAFHSEEHPKKGRNRGWYKNRQLDQLLDQGVTVMNRDKRRIIYNQVQKMIQKEIVFIPLWYEEQIAVVQKNILHYSLSDIGDFYYLTRIRKRK